VWNVNLSDTDSRTMATAEVIEGFRTGLVTADAFVWRDGMADWVAILDCVELAPLLSGPTDPPAPVAGQTPHAPAVADIAPGAPAATLGGVPALTGGAAATGSSAARTASAKAQPSADLFGNIDIAGSEESEVATSARGAPVLPGATAYDDKPTGQRNENSVLFSLDALKAGFTGGAPSGGDKGPKPVAPKPGAPRPAQPSNPDDPFGMGAGGGVAGIGGGGSPLFTLSSNQALLTAPAPPEPKPVAAAPVYAPGSIPPAGMDDKTKKMVLFGGIGAGALILLLLGLLVFGGGKDKDESAASDAKPAESQQAAKVEPPKPEPEAKPDAKKEEPAAAPSAATSATPEEKKPDEAKADASKAAAHSGSTSTATKKEEPAAAGPSTAPPFSKASAISALGSAAASAGGCKKPGGPTGTGKVQVTFAPSGRVTSATVMGAPFAGTAVGGCVAGAFRRAKVPAFSGNPVTVSKSFAIN
jgi:hypothetical protein